MTFQVPDPLFKILRVLPLASSNCPVMRFWVLVEVPCKFNVDTPPPVAVMLPLIRSAFRFEPSTNNVKSPPTNDRLLLMVCTIALVVVAPVTQMAGEVPLNRNSPPVNVN